MAGGTNAFPVAIPRRPSPTPHGACAALAAALLGSCSVVTPQARISLGRDVGAEHYVVEYDAATGRPTRVEYTAAQANESKSVATAATAGVSAYGIGQLAAVKKSVDAVTNTATKAKAATRQLGISERAATQRFEAGEVTKRLLVE
ncbi:hypothetical protein BH23VER1_BH23VER1_13430 [soil metagenome]